MIAENQTQYERNQGFNRLVSWHHGRRFNLLMPLFDELALSVGPRPIRVLDIGCAHAKLFELVKDKFNVDYTGIEVQDELVEAAKKRYGGRPNFSVIQDDIETRIGGFAGIDMVVAMEILEHIPDPAVPPLVEEIARIRPRLFVCSVPVEFGPPVWIKNLSSLAMGYVRHRDYTWRESFWAGLGRLDKLAPHGTWHKGFDWRRLAQIIGRSFKVREIRKIPFDALPSWLSMSVFLVAEPRH